MLAMSHAAFWWVMASMLAGQTDRQTDRHQAITLCSLLDVSTVIWHNSSCTKWASSETGLWLRLVSSGTLSRCIFQCCTAPNLTIFSRHTHRQTDRQTDRQTYLQDLWRPVRQAHSYREWSRVWRWIHWQPWRTWQCHNVPSVHKRRSNTALSRDNNQPFQLLPPAVRLLVSEIWLSHHQYNV